MGNPNSSNFVSSTSQMVSAQTQELKNKYPRHPQPVQFVYASNGSPVPNSITPHELALGRSNKTIITSDAYRMRQLVNAETGVPVPAAELEAAKEKGIRLVSRSEYNSAKRVWVNEKTGELAHEKTEGYTQMSVSNYQYIKRKLQGRKSSKRPIEESEPAVTSQEVALEKAATESVQKELAMQTVAASVAPLGNKRFKLESDGLTSLRVSDQSRNNSLSVKGTGIVSFSLNPSTILACNQRVAPKICALTSITLTK